MRSSSGLSGLNSLQFAFRSIQLFCCSLPLAIFSYYIFTLTDHRMEMRTGVLAVEGIAAIATLYTALCLLLPLCCSARHPAASFNTYILDISFAMCFLYIAIENRSASGGCVSGTTYTVYGAGDPLATPGSGTTGTTQLPTFQLACRLMMSCLIVSCIVIPFFLLSALLQVYIKRTYSRSSQPIRDTDSESITGWDGQKYRLPPQQSHGLHSSTTLEGSAAASAVYPDKLSTHS